MSATLVEISNSERFLDEFLEHYLGLSFGSLSKREIDILLMHLLIKYGDLERRSNYELSILFRVTERRVRSLRHEAKLRYVSNVDTYVRTEFGRLLEQTQLVAEQEKILFVVEDAFLRDGIQARLKAMGNFADYSFNREILRVTYEAQKHHDQHSNQRRFPYVPTAKRFANGIHHTCSFTASVMARHNASGSLLPIPKVLSSTLSNTTICRPDTVYTRPYCV